MSQDQLPGRDGIDEQEMPTGPVLVMDPPGPRYDPAVPERSRPPEVKPPVTVRIARISTFVLGGLSVLLVGFLLFVFVFSSFAESRSQAGLQRVIARSLSYQEAPIGGLIPLGTPVARLDIPAIGVRQVVIEGTTSDELRKGPGHLPESPLPGQVGNSVIAAHRVAWGGPFRSIDSLQKGDVIEVVTGQGHFTYKVASKRTATPHDVSVFQATIDNRLTLVTSANLAASRREVVVAKLVGKAEPAPAARPNVVPSVDDGLTAQHAALPAFFLFAEVLLVVVAATVLAYRRLPRVSSYILTTPLLLAALWLFYESLGRLLPATL